MRSMNQGSILVNSSMRSMYASLSILNLVLLLINGAVKLLNIGLNLLGKHVE